MGPPARTERAPFGLTRCVRLPFQFCSFPLESVAAFGMLRWEATMKRRLAAVAVTVWLLGALAFAQNQDFSKVQIKVSRVAGNVYMLEGAGGNIGASVGEDGIVVADDQYAPLADKIQEALKGNTDKPVRFIINTHYHPDHTGGNEYFQKQAPIITHDNVRKRLEEGGVAGNG